MWRKRGRILLVDDDAGVRAALRRTLSWRGYEVLVADGAAAALEVLEREAVDVVISDHLMPGTSGLALLTEVRGRHPEVLRLLLTGAADVETALRAINEGHVFRMLTKPWDDDALRATLAAAFVQVELDREQRRLLAAARRHADSMSVRG